MADSSSNQNRYTPPNQSVLYSTDFATPFLPFDVASPCHRKASGNRRKSGGWAAEMHQYDDPTVDLSVRPIMYYGGSVWGKLPHQILAAANKTLPPPSPTDYMTEVRRGLLMPKANN
ncbi:unknown protein [Arabidopsis thaliana]|uniref:MLP3.3 protein n=1 Tax=Arabidopsis thaliana TaxID=3702 RepID=Q9SSF2_ARATH|nr:unknown protein [Arabidopsis thaliana]